ncbi:MAG: hypothetical protein JXR62_07025 [Bacilli bacterium]|nr:hypothetical protein [Bacilli bacterium]
MNADYIYFAIPIIVVRYLMIHNYLFLLKKVYLSTLEKLYLLDIWVAIVVAMLYLRYSKEIELPYVIGYIITFIVVIVSQKIYIKQLKYAKYELYSRKTRDMRDFETFQTEYSHECYLEESTKSQTLSIFFRKPDKRKNIVTLQLLTMNRELFKQFDEKNRVLNGMLGLGLTLMFFALFGYFLVTLPIS